MPLTIFPKTIEPINCQYCVELDDENNVRVLIEDKEQSDSDYWTQYIILNDDFNHHFIRNVFVELEYCINEWSTINFNTIEETELFLKNIGMKTF